MKKSSIYYFSLAAIATGSLASCQDYDPFDEETVKESVIRREFTKNFEARYGKIDPNHTWGLYDLASSLSATRTVNVNHNLWLAEGLSVPGYPDIYYKNGTLHNTEYVGEKATISYTKPDDVDVNDTGNPVGDLTAEEIAYVSWWFRTHRYPSSIEVHWTNFFSQELSADNDRDADGYIVNIVPEYKAGNNMRAQEVSEFTIDQFAAQTFDGSGSVQNTQLNGYDHVNNHNAGSANRLVSTNPIWMSSDPWPDGWDEVDVHRRTITYFTGSGTEDFAAHYSNDEAWRSNDNTNHKVWALVHLAFTGPSGREYDGYYLGFDYSFYKNNAGVQELLQDGYYSNWIFKLSEAVGSSNSTLTRRIMCEDLGNTYDFDFDDVVFDVRYNLDRTQTYTPGTDVTATITLQAAAGTMPIYVGVDPTKMTSGYEKYEAHRLLGQGDDYTRQVNAGTDYAIAPAANYQLTFTSTNPADIPVVVYNTVLDKYVNINHSAKTEYKKDKDDYAPQMFGVPTSVLWMQENELIEKSYDKFKDWAQNENDNSEWYLSIIDPSLLWGVVGEQSNVVVNGNGTVTLPNSTGEPLTYDIHMRKGLDGTTELYQSKLRPNTEAEIVIPQGYNTCYILGSYIDLDNANTQVRMEKINDKELNPLIITENRRIKVTGPVYVLALNLEGGQSQPSGPTFKIELQVYDGENRIEGDALSATGIFASFNYWPFGSDYYNWSGTATDWSIGSSIPYTINPGDQYEFVSCSALGDNPALTGTVTLVEGMEFVLVFKKKDGGSASTHPSLDDIKAAITLDNFGSAGLGSSYNSKEITFTVPGENEGTYRTRGWWLSDYDLTNVSTIQLGVSEPVPSGLTLEIQYTDNSITSVSYNGGTTGQISPDSDKKEHVMQIYLRCDGSTEESVKLNYLNIW